MAAEADLGQAMAVAKMIALHLCVNVFKLSGYRHRPLLCHSLLGRARAPWYAGSTALSISCDAWGRLKA